MSMLLAEALKERANLETAIRELKARIAGVAVHDEDETPTESAADLVEQLLAMLSRAATLTARINRSNNSVTVRFEGKSQNLMTAVLLRDEWKRQAEALRSIMSEVERALGGRSSYDFGRRRAKDEVKLVSDLAVKDLRARADTLSGRVSALDMEIQKINFTAELAE